MVQPSIPVSFKLNPQTYYDFKSEAQRLSLPMSKLLDQFILQGLAKTAKMHRPAPMETELLFGKQKVSGDDIIATLGAIREAKMKARKKGIKNVN